MTEGVTDLVRGTLCPALKALFEHGLKKPSLLGGACHPWLFIEEVSGYCTLKWERLGSGGWWLGRTEGVLCPQAAGREVERDFDSVYSRLVLCKTYR